MRTRRSSPSRQGQPLEYVVPDNTLLIENAIATTLVGDAPDAAKAFVDFLYTPEAQASTATTASGPSWPRCSPSSRTSRRPTNLATVDE